MAASTDIETLRADWDGRYREVAAGPPLAAVVLRDNVHLLPPQGMALDLACGRGGNALLLARHGLSVDAWDLSAVAIGQLRDFARRQGLGLVAEVRDVVAQPPPALSYDVITVSYFLERALAQTLMMALRPGGLLFYQTFGPERIAERGPRNPAYRLQQGELLRLFAALTPCLYREDGGFGDPQYGLRGEAMYIGARSAL